MEDIEKMKKLNREIVRQISQCTNLSVNEIRKKSMSEIEIIQNIKAKKPVIYFGWKRGEKLGWQTYDMKFVSEKILKKREERLEKLIATQ